MEMHNNEDLFQLESNMPAEYDADFDMEDLFFGYDFTNYLIGSDVNLANINQGESGDKLNLSIQSILQEPESVIGKSHNQILHESMSVTRTSSHIPQESETVTAKFPVKSPWHESDSGVSDAMSFVGSPTDPNVAETITEEESFSTEVFKQRLNFDQTSMSNTEVSDNLPAFSFSRKYDKSILKATQKNAENSTINTSGRPVRRCSKRKYCESKSDSDDSNSDDHYHSQMAAKQTSAQLRNRKNELSTQRCTNVIKVVKIATPPTSTSDAATEDLLKALDDRSKKNAQQAKINREKKKVYIKKLEDDRESLMKENSKLSSQVEQMMEDMVNLETEVEYLKSVLQNSSALSGLLKNISNIKEVKLSTSLSSHHRRVYDDNDHSYNLVKQPVKKMRRGTENFTNAGVCLHVSNGEACLEFCAHCSALAQKTHDYSDCSKS